MVEINNQRKGVPRYAGVVGGAMDQKTGNHGYDASLLSWKLFTDYSDHPRKLVLR